MLATLLCLSFTGNVEIATNRCLGVGSMAPWRALQGSQSAAVAVESSSAGFSPSVLSRGAEVWPG